MIKAIQLNGILSQQTVLFLLLLGESSLLLMAFALGEYLWIGAMLVLMLAAVIIESTELGIYILLFLTPFLPSVELLKSGGRAIGLPGEYLITALVIVSWLLRKLKTSDFNLRASRLILPLFLLGLLIVVSLFRGAIELGNTAIINGIVNSIGIFEYMLLFVVITDTFKRREQVRLALLILMAAVVINSGIELLFHYLQGGGSPRLSPSFSTLLNKNAVANPNSLATLLMIGSVMIGVLIMNNRGVVRVFQVVALAVPLLAIVLTSSRSALLAFLVAFAALAMINRKKLWLGFMIAAVALLMLRSEKLYDRYASIAEIATSDKIIRTFKNLDLEEIDWEEVEMRGIEGYGTNVVSGAMRFTHWLQATDMVAERPLLGYGFGLMQQFTHTPTSENLFLDFWIGVGIGGVLLLLILFWRASKSAWRLARDPQLDRRLLGQLFLAMLLGTFVVTLTGSVLLSAKVACYFWASLALLMVVCNEKDTVRQ